MHVVIVGAGNIGAYIAAVMSQKKHDVTLIDHDEKRLEEIARNLDIAVRTGSGTDWPLLQELIDSSPSLLLALTESDEKNLVICNIAKNLGYPKTIARIRNEHYFHQKRLDFLRLFYADHFITPEFLVANEIFKQVLLPGSNRVESFSNGAIYMRSLTVPKKWHNAHLPLKELSIPEGLMIGLICRDDPPVKGTPPLSRKKKIIFPHGNDCLLPGDEVTLIGETDVVLEIEQFFGNKSSTVNSAAIVGGSLVGYHLARLLSQKDIEVKIIESDFKRCAQLSEKLPRCTILHHSETDARFLDSEHIDKADYLIACSDQDEINFLVSALAKQLGCSNVISTISSFSHPTLIDQLGIARVVSPCDAALNAILSFVEAENISSMVSLYDHQAEIMEIRVPLDSQIAGIPLSTLGPLLPKDFLIAVIQNRGRILVANGNRILSPGDTVIAISSPEHLSELSSIF